VTGVGSRRSPVATTTGRATRGHRTNRAVGATVMFSALMILVACTGGAPAPPAPSLPPPPSTPVSTSTTAAPPTASTTGAPVPVAAEPVGGGAASAQALITTLLPTEEALHDPAVPVGRLPALGAVEQRQLGTLADHPEWMSTVLAALPAGAGAGVRAIVAADQDLGGVPGPTPTAIPSWQILRPQPAAVLLADYHTASAATGVPWPVLAAIHLVESRMGRIRGPSGAGAEGPMQFLPTTWTEYGGGGDINSDADAIAAAARFLHANGAPADLGGALYRYNRSTSYVHAILAYASVMSADPRAFDAFYGWQVYVHTTAGTFLLPEGYGAP
jgi:hypothetical protein